MKNTNTSVMKNRNKEATWKRGLAACLIFALSLVLAWQPIRGQRANAASSKSLYVKDMKVFTVNGSGEETKKAAEDWCSKQDGEWKVVDGNLNSGADGALKKNVAVYLVYQTTTDPREAITDLAVMNEQGNYSESEYKGMIEQQKELYKDLVTDMRTMLKEYRENVKNGVDTAIQAQKFMNGYVEDDSNKPLGDFLMDATEDQLIPVLMQANGRIVLMIQEKLAYACDTGKTTWLERMEKLGSYKNLRSKALSAYNNNTKRADNALESKYADKAREIYESWTDVVIHIAHVKKYRAEHKIDDMSDKEYDDWSNKTINDEEAKRFRDELAVMKKLATYKYEEGTLLDYFSQPSEELGKNNCRKLYPLVACLTEGQQASINESVSMFTMVMNASSASAFNDNKTAENELIEKDMTSADKEMIKETEKAMDNALDKWKTNKFSIYDGVDREVFTDGVAVTSTALNNSNATEKSWAEALIEDYKISPVIEGVLIGTGIFAVGSIVSAVCYAKNFNSLARSEFIYAKRQYDDMFTKSLNAWKCENAELEAKWDAALEAHRKNYEGVTFAGNGRIETFEDQTEIGKQKLLEKALEGDSPTALKTKILKGLKIGFAVATILLAAADIAIAGVALYQYYNRDHLPIPHHMVDLSYNKAKETSYTVYKSVPDTNGNYGDLNGGSGKQWLALYASRDEEAGSPILADEFVVKMGTTDAPEKQYQRYQPLHMFGTPSVAQNLTYADGDNGFSYNDKENGIYLYFQNNPFAFFEDDDQVGTVIGGGSTTAVAGILGVLVGGFIGFVIADKRRKKREA